jgi:hypothetical protein
MSRRELEVLGVEVTLSIEEAERERGYMITRAEGLSFWCLGEKGGQPPGLCE